MKILKNYLNWNQKRSFKTLLLGNNNNNANNMNTIMFMPMNGRRLHRRWADDLVRGSLNLLYQSRIFNKS